MIDLIIKIDTQIKAKISDQWKDIVEPIESKYPFIKITDDEILFDGLSKADFSINNEENEIVFSTNSSLYPYMAFTIVEIAKQLGIDTIIDPQDNRPNKSLDQISSELSNFIDDYQRERSNQAQSFRHVIMPKINELFTKEQIENSINVLKNDIGENTILPNPNKKSYDILNRAGRVIAEVITDADNRYVELTVVPYESYDVFEKIIEKLTSLLGGEFSKIERLKN